MLVAWLEFGHKRTAGLMSATAIAYAAMISLLIIPHFVGANSNPIQSATPTSGMVLRRWL